jgi:hypothetical protein
MASVTAGNQSARTSDVRPGRLRRWLMLGLVIAVAVTVAATYGTPVYLQGRLLYLQHQCMTYSEAGDRVIYRYDPLIAMGLQYADAPDFDNDKDGPDGPVPEDACPDVMPPHVAPFGGTGDPKCLEMLNRRLGFVLYDDFQPVFVHTLTTSSGQTRLVVASVAPPITRAPMSGPVIETLVFEPAGWMGKPHMLKRRLWQIDDPMLALEPTSFMWGRVDDTDGARFHLRYRRGGHEFGIDGKLDADGRSASIQ